MVRVTITGDGGTWEIPKFLSFRQKVTMAQFNDACEIEFGDPDTFLLWDKIDNEFTITSYIRGTADTFRISELDVSCDSKGFRSIKCLGTSKQFDIGLSELPPKKYVNKTDNAIIQEMMAGSSFNLDGAVNLKEFNVEAGEMRIEVAMRAARQNGYFLYASGGTIYKKKVDGSGGGTKTYIDENTRNHRITKSTTQVRSKIIGYSQDDKDLQINSKGNVNPTSIFTGKAIPVDRDMYIKANSKNIGELNSVVTENKFKAQPLELLSFEVKGRDDIELNTIANIKLNKLKISCNMVMYEKTFAVTSDGEVTTQLNFVGVNRSFR